MIVVTLDCNNFIKIWLTRWNNLFRWFFNYSKKNYSIFFTIFNVITILTNWSQTSCSWTPHNYWLQFWACQKKFKVNSNHSAKHTCFRLLNFILFFSAIIPNLFNTRFTVKFQFNSPWHLFIIRLNKWRKTPNRM